MPTRHAGGICGMTVSELFLQFKDDYILVRGLTKSTEENYGDAVLSFTRVVGDLEITSVTPRHLAEWREALKCTHAPSTIRAFLSKLKNILVWSNSQSFTCFPIDQIYLPKVPQGLPKYLTAEQIQLMLDKTEFFPHKVMIAFLFSTGLRATELANLNKEDIQGNKVYVKIGKCSRSRTVFVDDFTLDLLRQYLLTRKDSSEALFWTKKGTRFSRHGVLMVVKWAGDRVGIKVHTHMMRHSYATDLMRNNMHLYSISQLLGHSNVSTTQIYLHVENDDLARQYRQTHTVLT